MFKRSFKETSRLAIQTAQLLTFSRTSNLLKSFFDKIAPKPNARALPMALMVEPTNKCNLRCRMCPAVIEDSIGKRPDMTLDQFNSVVTDLSSSIFYLAMWNYGEPLMNKHISDMIKLANQSNLFVEMHSNGHLLKSYVDKAINGHDFNISDLMPDKLSISVDSLDEETYSYLRKGGKLKRLKENVGQFIIKRNNSKLSKPRVSIQFILMKENANELENQAKIKQFVEELQIDEYTIKYFSYRGDNIEDFLPESKDLRLKLKNSESTPRPCLRPWTSTLVLSNGIVLPCCYDYSAHWPLGDINEKPIKDIWNDKPYRSFRSMLLDGNEPKICKNCPGRDFGTLYKIG